MSNTLSPRELSFAELKEIASILKSSDSLAEFSLKFGNVELSLSTHHAQSTGPLRSERPAAVSAPAAAVVSPAAVASAPATATPTAASPTKVHRGNSVKSPMIGTFYRSPEPGAPPFVNVGDRVKKGDVICLIEVMKLINSITAEHDGTVTEIFVENASPVEFGQALMAIDPS